MTLPSCRDWAVVYTTRDEAAVKEFVREMKKNAPSLGLALAAPSHVVLGDSRPVTYVQRLDMVLDAKPKPQIVMVVIPNDKVMDNKLFLPAWICSPVVFSINLASRATTTRPSRRSATWKSRSPASASPPPC